MGTKLQVLGEPLERIGLTVVSKGTVTWPAKVMGAVIVPAAIWSLGLVIKATAQHKLDDAFHAVLNRVPVVNAIDKPVSQVVGPRYRGRPGGTAVINLVLFSNV